MAKPKRKAKAPPRKLSAPQKRGGTSRVPAAAASLVQPQTHLLLLLGFLLTGVVFLHYPAFQWLGIPIHLTADHLNLFLFLGAVLLFLGFWMLPARSTELSIPRWVAYPLLLAFMGLTLFLRFYRADEPMGRYWDDPAICIIDPCNIFELHVFRIDFAIGHREPFFPYVAAGFWWLFPQMKALAVERMVSALYDVAAVWVFYRLGREVTGQRLPGLLLAALGAVSKPMIMQNLGGMPGLTLPLVISLVMWFQFRVMRKSDLSHFLQWGFILGFGFYSYIAYRPWMLFMAFMTLLWILFTPEPEAARPDKPAAKKSKFPPAGLQWALRVVLVLGVAGAFLFLLDRMFVMFFDNPVSRFWRSSTGVWLLIQAVFFGAFGYFFSIAQGKEKKLVGWGLGVLLACFLVYPLAMNAEIGIKIQDNKIHFQNFAQVWRQVTDCVKALFYTGDDRSDMNVEGDPFFDYHAAVLAFAGLIFVLAKPSRDKIFLVLCAMTGTAGRILTVDPTSAKLLGALPALLLLPSWGLATWLNAAFDGSWKRKWFGVLLAGWIVAFVAWEGQGTFQRVYDKWWNLIRPDILVSHEITAQLPTKRVYMGVYNGMGYASPAVEGVIHDGEPLYLLDKSNIIDVLPGEPRKDLAVIIAGLDREWAPLLKKDFPKAQWIPQWEYYQSKADVPALYDVVISASDIPEKPGKLFSYRVVPDKKWVRRVYATYFGLGRGMIQYEDSSATLNPFPPGMGAHSAAGEGDWEAPADGDYTFSVNSPNPIQIWIDGKKVLSSIIADWVQPKPVSATVYLTKGPHHVKFLTFMRVDAWFDRVTIQDSKTGYKAVLGE